MEGIKQWIEAEGSGHWFFIAFPICLLMLLIWFKDRRVRFLIPSLIISIVILNPLFYIIWDRLGLYAYWRMLWAVPVVPVMAAVIPSISEWINKPQFKVVVAAVGVGAVMVGGTFLYNTAGSSFIEAANASKLPDYVVQIADRLLKLNDHPRVIVQHPIGVYIRQYSGKIETLYGRNLSGYITWGASQQAYMVNDEINNSASDLMSVSQFMLDSGYDYLVVNERENICGFEPVAFVGDYVIYEPVGTPHFAREWNELGQMTALTTLDSDGQAINDKYGYSTRHREYDSYNNVTKEWYTNTAYEVVKHSAGFSMFEQTWEGTRHKAKRYLDSDGNPVIRTDGYSKVVWNTGENGMQYVSFYNINGEEMGSRGLNLAYENATAEGWSDWMTPEPGIENICFSLGIINLDHRIIGDMYTSQIEIEFKDVTDMDGRPFYFWTQGSVDGRWDIGNIWDGSLVWLEAPPGDGVYKYISTRVVDENMAKASSFELGFRCDNWASGSFRVRNIKVEKGNNATEWTPGL